MYQPTSRWSECLASRPGRFTPRKSPSIPTSIPRSRHCPRRDPNLGTYYLKMKITAIFKLNNSILSTQMGVAEKLSSIKMHLRGENAWNHRNYRSKHPVLRFETRNIRIQSTSATNFYQHVEFHHPITKHATSLLPLTSHVPTNSARISPSCPATTKFTFASCCPSTLLLSFA